MRSPGSATAASRDFSAASRPHHASNEVLLETKHISLAFKGVTALSDVTFDVPKGEICALIGPNGAGKSSLLNVINGIYRAQSGEIVLDGKHFRKITPIDAARRGIGRTFQHNELFVRLSVLDNVLTGLASRGKTTFWENTFRVGRDRAERRAFLALSDKIVAFLGLEKYVHRHVSTLPYGIQKRVDLARALVSEPTLLLLDEPMAGMNQEEKQDMRKIVSEVNSRFGTTIVLIEHDIGIVMKLAHHVVVLDYGRKIADGTPEQVRNNPVVIKAYLGENYGQDQVES
jgi:branched-chain amino acid transport system ATP-binding protein